MSLLGHLIGGRCCSVSESLAISFNIYCAGGSWSSCSADDRKHRA